MHFLKFLCLISGMSVFPPQKITHNPSPIGLLSTHQQPKMYEKACVQILSLFFITMAMAVVSGVEHNHTLGHKNKLQGELARIQNTVLVRDWQIQSGEASLSIYIYPNCTQTSN